ncbi:MAG TPA: hypothetical protein VN231_10850 [Allosphingosinicella sp.]|nr:hypothetical protein [Allosphingosinicella sp.]
MPRLSPERLEAFRQAAGAAFAAAADAACAAGEVDPARLRGLRRLVVQSASGATESAFYEDRESVGAGALVFQYVFLEADIDIPDAADLRAVLVCWADPDRPSCADRLP